MSDIGSNANLDKVGRAHGLDLLINKNPSDKDGSVGEITMASTVEAILGAVYLDSDMKSVTKVMVNLGLMPRLVRRTGSEVPVCESTKEQARTMTTSAFDPRRRQKMVLKKIKDDSDAITQAMHKSPL